MYNQQIVSFKAAGKTDDVPVSNTVAVMYAPTLGPEHPMKKPNQSSCGISKIQYTEVADWSFDEQFNSFQSSGRAINISDNSIITSLHQEPKRAKSSASGKDKDSQGNAMKRRRVPDMDLLGDESSGPWAMPKIEEKPAEVETAQDEEKAVEKNSEDIAEKIEIKDPTMHILEPEEEEEMWEIVNERKKGYVMPPRPARGSKAEEAKTTFHGSALFDYQGKPWCEAPSGIRGDGGDHNCFIPKKCIKKYTGHTKGVQSIEFFPDTGHLLLSGSMDGKCKIWDVLGDRNVKRTYSGHSEGVRSIHMGKTGSEFLSSGFDRYIRLWDTETGQAKGTFCNRKMGYQVKFYPNDNNIFLVAASDNKVYQWDARSGTVCQEYNYHLQPCNTITFCDEGRKFITTSDDKKILVWEYDIPVPIKYIAEPGMHSVPAVTIHPSGQYFAGQSMDNTIVVYSCGEKVRQLKKKTFKGHNNSGYACQIGFSPNGQFLMSGDGMGSLHVWDWKSGKSYRTFHAHENGPTMGAVWSPLHPSFVATCGWDGLIKLWD